MTHDNQSRVLTGVSHAEGCDRIYFFRGVIGENCMSTRQRGNNREAARALRRDGVGPSDIAERLGVSRQSVWRWTRGVEPSDSSYTDVTPPAPIDTSQAGAQAQGARAPAQGGRLIDWPGELVHGVDRLRERADSGSAAAARDLARLAASEIRAGDQCAFHVTAEEAGELAQGVYETAREHLLGPFVRRLSHVFDLREDAIEAEIYDVLDTIADTLNRKREAAVAAKE